MTMKPIHNVLLIVNNNYNFKLLSLGKSAKGKGKGKIILQTHE
jgi:hypothetical protein